jgi:hypothetical protein
MCKNVRFRENFLFQGWFPGKVLVFAKIFTKNPGSGSAFRKENFCENTLDNKNFCKKSFVKTKKFFKNFCESFDKSFRNFLKAKKYFHKIFAKIRK